MTQSRLFMFICISFCLGIALASAVKIDWLIIGTVVVILVALIFIVPSQDKINRSGLLLWLSLYAGLAYAGAMAGRALIPSNFLSPIIVFLTNVRLNIENNIIGVLAEPYGSLLNGIMLGTKSGLGYQLTSAFKTTGLTHIIAISGYNVTIIINSFYLIAKPLPFKLRMGLSIGLIFLFIILTGGSSSVVRAGIMGGLVIVARLLGRQALALNSLIFASLLMIIGESDILTKDIGFQLSVAATIGLIMITPILMKRVGERGVVKFLPASLKEVLFSTLAAQVMTIPIILYYFKSLSLVSPAANLLVLPIIPPLMFIGFLVIAGGLVSQPIGYILGFGAYPVLHLIVWLVERLATIPYAGVTVPLLSKWLIIPYYGLIFFVIHKNGVGLHKGQDEKI